MYTIYTEFKIHTNNAVEIKTMCLVASALICIRISSQVSKTELLTTLFLCLVIVKHDHLHIFILMGVGDVLNQQMFSKNIFERNKGNMVDLSKSKVFV